MSTGRAAWAMEVDQRVRRDWFRVVIDEKGRCRGIEGCRGLGLASPESLPSRIRRPTEFGLLSAKKAENRRVATNSEERRITIGATLARAPVLFPREPVTPNYTNDVPWQREDPLGSSEQRCLMVSGPCSTEETCGLAQISFRGARIRARKAVRVGTLIAGQGITSPPATGGRGRPYLEISKHR